MSIEQSLQSALHHHQAGHAAEAESVCREILTHQPDHTAALRLLGIICYQSGRHGPAELLFRRLIAMLPDDPQHHLDLGATLLARGRADEAVACYVRAAALRPDRQFATAFFELGLVLQNSRRPDLAVECYQRALGLSPEFADAANNLGNAFLTLNRLDDAIAGYRRAVALHPAHATAWYNLGNAQQARGWLDEAMESFRRAVHADANLAEAHNNLGLALLRKQRPQEAIDAYRRAIEVRPKYANAWNNLGEVLLKLGRADESLECCRRALELSPSLAQAHLNLGSALETLGQRGSAMEQYREALALEPLLPEAHFNLGSALQQMGRHEEAGRCFQIALEIKPDHLGALNNLGLALRARGRLDDATHYFRRTLTLRPDYTEARNNLGITLLDLERLDEAIECYEQAIAIGPAVAEVYCNLANALKDAGRLDQAIEQYRRAVAQPGASTVPSQNLLYALMYSDRISPDELRVQQQCWNERFARPLAAAIRPHHNTRDPARPLRIGYLSPDFRQHAVAHFIHPLLQHHDRRQFPAYCYSITRRPDQTTTRLASFTEHWFNAVGLSDDQLADRIRQDEIDILVDLALHTADNRLLVLARKSAPVQMTYLGYCGTTGLETIDYRLSDRYLDPGSAALPGRSPTAAAFERPFPLAGSYWCYPPRDEPVDPGPPPAQAAGHLTFGSLNNFCKISPSTLAAWVRVLQCIGDSRLMVYTLPGQHREQFAAHLAQQGINPRRLSFVSREPLWQYLQSYRRIDIALDPFPYNGGTTTCDALWMGVPVVSLAGQTPMSRAGLSLLSNVGLADLVADNVEQYVSIAAKLAVDLPRLAELRATLRPRMLASPLMDAPGFVRDVEAAYRTMWQWWCARSHG